MAAAITWAQVPGQPTAAAQHTAQRPTQIPAPEALSAARTAEQLRTTLMGLAPAQLRRGRWLAPASAAALGLVDVRAVAPRIVALPSPPWSAPTQRFWMRRELAERLEQASRLLPPHLAFGFWEGFRPLEVQRAVWKKGTQLLREAHPHLSLAQLEAILDTYIARPNADAPHSQGRAVDIALLDASGRTPQVLEATHEENRLAMQEFAAALSGAGLSNYEPEWWHWSYDA